MTNLIDTVKSDADSSRNRWEGAVQSAKRDGDRAQATRWEAQAAQCDEHYAAAVEAIEAGDLETAEAELESANSLESSAGDNCDAHHALQAVRAALSNKFGFEALVDDQWSREAAGEQTGSLFASREDAEAELPRLAAKLECDVSELRVVAW